MAGRRLPLLVAAAERLSRGGELSESEIASRSERTRSPKALLLPAEETALPDLAGLAAGVATAVC